MVPEPLVMVQSVAVVVLLSAQVTPPPMKLRVFRCVRLEPSS